MAVKDTLDKITERHPDVIGTMVVHDGRVRHILEAPHDMISTGEVLETFSEIFEHTAMLEDEGLDLIEMLVDFANHSFIVRSIEGGILAVLAPRLQRGQLVKLHVGLGLFGKAVQTALEDEASSGPVEAKREVVAAPVVDALLRSSQGQVPGHQGNDRKPHGTGGGCDLRTRSEGGGEGRRKWCSAQFRRNTEKEKVPSRPSLLRVTAPVRSEWPCHSAGFFIC